MKQIVKGILFTIVSLGVILLFSTTLNYDNSKAFDTVATFLSITTGFTITALSIIATSTFSKDLYKVEDKTDNSKTLLHVLVGKFRNATCAFILTIGLITIHKFLPEKTEVVFSIKEVSFTLVTLVKSLIWYMTVISFWTFLRLFHTFSKFVIKSATVQNQ